MSSKRKLRPSAIKNQRVGSANAKVVNPINCQLSSGRPGKKLNVDFALTFFGIGANEREIQPLKTELL